MATKIKWGDRTWELYKPKVNQKRRGFLGGLMLADVILPATFGIGFMITKLIMKVNPLYLYN